MKKLAFSRTHFQLRMLGKFKFSRHQVVIQSDARIW
jgi:hypothetical protein